MKIGLVLSGGGSRGFAHLGVLKAMEELGIVPDIVSGASAGALVGALYCQGLKAQEIADYVLKKGVKRNITMAFSKLGIFNLNKFQKLILELIPHNSFENLKIPLVVCATNIKKGEIEYFNTGDLSKIVSASCAIPGIFTPVKINGKSYVDGGIMDNLPILPIQNLCDFKIAVNVMPTEKNMPIGSAKEIIMKCLMISIGKQSESKRGNFDIVIEPPNISHFNGLKIIKAQEMFELGYQSGLKQLSHIANQI